MREATDLGAASAQRHAVAQIHVHGILLSLKKECI